MKSFQWFVADFGDTDFTVSKSEFKEFLSSATVTWGKIQEKTIGQIFCEQYQVKDSMLSNFVSDTWCIDRIETFYVR